MPSFNELDLTNSKVSTGGPILKAGVYLVETRDAAFEKTQSGQGQVAKVIFDDVEGLGQITESFNIFHSSAEAQRIGREQFKTMLTHGGHPNPDRPTNVATVNALRLKIMVKADGTYEKNGETLTSYRIARYLPADHPAKTGPTAVAETAQSGGMTNPATSPNRPLDDDIPF